MSEDLLVRGISISRKIPGSFLLRLLTAPFVLSLVDFTAMLCWLQG